MWREPIRRLLVVLLSVTLTVGLVTRAVQAAYPDTAVAAMSGDMPMHGSCDGCVGNEKAMTPAACAFSCSVIAVAPVTAVAFDPIAAEIMTSAAQPPVTGHVFPPDPYPPRPFVLN